MNLYTELTPNPATLKFVSDRVFLPVGTLDFPTADAAAGQSKIAEKLFKYPFTKGVFIGRNFVTLTKGEGANWEDVIPVVKDEIKTFALSGEKFAENLESTATQAGETDLEKRIIEVLEDNVRPAVAMDGGDIIFKGIEDGVVKLEMRGSCSGCPSSTLTLKSGIQSLLMRMFPNDVKAVEAI
jgi:Fe-S cluster biogenesis protein NfuA